MRQTLKWIFSRSVFLYVLLILLLAVSVDSKKAAKERARYLVGVFYNQSLSNYTDGIVYFDYLAHLRPNDGRNYFLLGYCYLYLQQYDKALAYFDKASRLSPEDALTKQYLAHVKSKIAKDDPAVPLPVGEIGIPLE